MRKICSPTSGAAARRSIQAKAATGASPAARAPAGNTGAKNTQRQPSSVSKLPKISPSHDQQIGGTAAEQGELGVAEHVGAHHPRRRAGGQG
ncbi:hypothetical protein HD597_005474 [Nonomuraea thailandensis]|uniref:Uncharacterized protein n=1 Tax=Nonomuraea thailandensis TaxID=1188745 RepID=A0A9X2GG22_9ACTN|nr:hypothetical protein [Nonomuraea thailandensis]MCP2358454.1 hypothetical protein [Nonomuraea thailandensis]